ncbi:Uncharacterised protein [Mycobacteroides abscessus subsp. abscessus]|nr:Uncharacterised protein [Mycobacteroides abscessus subsp. abscessus]
MTIRIGCHLDGRRDVRGPVGLWGVGGVLRTGEHDGAGVVGDEVGQKCRLFHRVGAVGDDDPGHVGIGKRGCDSPHHLRLLSHRDR